MNRALTDVMLAWGVGKGGIRPFPAKFDELVTEYAHCGGLVLGIPVVRHVAVGQGRPCQHRREPDYACRNGR